MGSPCIAHLSASGKPPTIGYQPILETLTPTRRIPSTGSDQVYGPSGFGVRDRPFETSRDSLHDLRARSFGKPHCPDDFPEYHQAANGQTSPEDAAEDSCTASAAQRPAALTLRIPSLISRTNTCCRDPPRRSTFLITQPCSVSHLRASCSWSRCSTTTWYPLPLQSSVAPGKQAEGRDYQRRSTGKTQQKTGTTARAGRYGPAPSPGSA